MKSALKPYEIACLVVFASCVSFTPIAAQQSTGTLQGRVLTSQGLPIPRATLFIKELGRGDVSSDSGFFAIHDIHSGVYTLVVTRVGFESASRQVELEPGQVLSLDFALSEKPVVTPEIVVTATRSEKTISDVPIPTSVITEKQIKAQSAVRLNDLLAEQQGMFITSNQFGMGIQVLGLDPAYTLILVDGEPVVGRTAGTLELTRLSVGNIQRVEVVKGPSSSLYGSDALAGVVNLITKQPNAPFDASFTFRYGTYNTLDLSARAETKAKDLGTSVFVERNSSDGYDLTPETPSRTIPRHTNYTVNPKLTYDVTDQSKFTLSGRYVTQSLSNTATVLVGGSNLNFDDRSTLLDWSVAPSVVRRFSATTKLEAKYYAAQYKTESKLTQPDGTVFDQSTFRQTYNKAEVQFDAAPATSMFTTVGGGYTHETVRADRISGDERLVNSSFVFGQQEWIPFHELDAITSFRFDIHTDYAAKFSPKISTLVRPASWLSARASAGSGFKAPTFQQLYLDFTNPQVGYSVYGSVGIRDAFQRLQQTGQIQSVLIDLNTLEKIRPENSTAYDAAIEVTPIEDVILKVAVFHNDLKDLIEASPIAIKNNGQPVYTYFNISKVFTQGFNGELVIKPLSSLTLSVSYQYLEAKDQNVLDDIRAGKIFKIGATGRARPVQEIEYGGLFNRSAHSGTVKLLYEDQEAGLSATIRGIVRSRYGFADNNGNNILDDDSEYAPGYALWNFTLSKSIIKSLTLQAGVDNLLDKSNREFTPNLPGRIVYIGFTTSY